MGGSSTQLIFYNGQDNHSFVDASHFWSHSYLNYGVQRIRDATMKYISSTVRASFNKQGKYVIENPCLLRGYSTEYDDMIFNGTGNVLACQKFIRKVVWPNKPCAQLKDIPCYISDIKHPAIHGHFYAMSVYYYALETVHAFSPSSNHSLAHW